MPYRLTTNRLANTFQNEVMNWPAMEDADGAQPEWWEVGANCTLTDEDIAGEGITENYERCLKVVTTADNAHAYQRFTYADQPRVKAGLPMSAAFAVWAVGGDAARVRLQSSVGSIGVSVDTVAAGWTILTVENIILDGTRVDVYLEVDTGTAYFVPLGVTMGEVALSLGPRGLRHRNKDSSVTVKTLTGLGDEATWTDIDCTASTSNIAAMAQLEVNMVEAVDDFTLAVRRNGAAGATGFEVAHVFSDAEAAANAFVIILDDGQVFEYYLDRLAGAANLDYGIISLCGWWEWE